MRYRSTFVSVVSAAALGLGAIPAGAPPALLESGPLVAVTAVTANLALIPAGPVEPAVGFAVGTLNAMGSRLPIIGTAADARRAFGINLVGTTVSGVPVRSASPARVSAAIAADVLAVTWLSQPVAETLSLRSCLASPAVSGVLTATATPAGCAALPSASGVSGGASCALARGGQPGPALPRRSPPGRVSLPLSRHAGPQLRTPFGLPAADTGAGQTAVIVGACNGSSTLADANHTFALARVALLAGVVADAGMAGAVVPLGWGVPAETVAVDDRAATDAVLARAALCGMSTLTASGVYDTAAPARMWMPNVAYLASSPWTTAVGGTTSAVGAAEAVLWQTGSVRAFESVGGLVQFGLRDITPDDRRDVVLAAAGGGPSLHVARPAWQAGVVGGYRQVPDVAALADPLTGLRVGPANGEYLARPSGGTGLATPIVAALTALAQARTETRTGLFAPPLYTRTAAGRPLVDDVRHVAAAVWIPRPGSGLVVAVDSAGERTRPRWDPVSGLGTPARDSCPHSADQARLQRDLARRLAA
jgi:hypothetical protein